MSRRPGCDECGNPNASQVGVFEYLCSNCKVVDGEHLEYDWDDYPATVD